MAIVLVFYPVGMTTKIKNDLVSDNSKLMRITANQMIAHYSVIFDPIYKSFKLLAFK